MKIIFYVFNLFQLIFFSKLQILAKRDGSFDQIGTALIRHYGYNCDGCMNSVWGIRWKCLVCPDFDYCIHCGPIQMDLANVEQFHVRTHPFVKITIPMQNFEALDRSLYYI